MIFTKRITKSIQDAVTKGSGEHILLPYKISVLSDNNIQIDFDF